LCKESATASRVTPFFKDRMVWLGAAIPFVVLSYNGLTVFVPGLNPMSLTMGISALRRMAYYHIHLNFPALGFAYLVSLDISLSLWLFHVLSKLQTGIITLFAGPVLSDMQVLYNASPIPAHEGFGAMVVLFGFGVWVARKHLGRVFRIGLMFRKTDEDSREIMSYRAAVWCFILGLVVIISYMHATGLTYFQSATFVLVVMIVFYAISRVICEGGVGFARSVYIGNAFMVNQFGSNVLGPQGLSAMGFSFCWSGDLRTMVMTQAMQGMKLTEGIERRRPLIWALMLAVVIALFGSLVTALYLGYTYGLYNCQRAWPVWPCATFHWGQVANYIQTPREPHGLTWGFMGVGGGVMSLLIFMRQRFIWWPVHYIGLPVCESLPMYYLWFTVFLAWLIKLLVIKLGTTALYERTRMFFLGMIFGSLATGGIWTVIGIITDNNVGFLRGVTLG